MKKTLLLLFSPLILFAQLQNIDIAAFERMQKEGVPVIDIRTPGEWRETGIIPGSHTITFFHADGRYSVPEFLAALKKLGITAKSPFILVCRSASRTRTLGSFLANKAGFEKVYELRGGILNWRAHGKPLIPYKR